MADEKHRRANRRTKEYWQEEIKKLKHSGLTVAEYSQKYGIKTHRLYKWRRNLNAGEIPASRKFVELPVRIREDFSRESYNIYIEPALHVRVGGYFNQDTLKHLIEVLRRVQ